ncbi:exodeoxyribonuclease VII large subunit [Garicola koreensis]|uniref:Exodeoxyribonuclease 7 large subunit n=1 Tax=Garicola koreensis TaxID=1262554 RepID=A0A7W5XJP5_9MICC|nr:exodeoxyribonuclease VII large subunit [Garicola koreensis]MBB3666572.1 exodeoxyribonuclease VII large subunit [Garicola koreensis]
MNYQPPHTKGRPSLAALPASSQETSEETPWPLSHFSGKLRAHIDRVAPTWVEGQLVEFNLRNGTAWMTLRDLEQEISFTAVAWRNVAGGLQTKGLAAGSRVVALVKPSLWEKTGRLSLVTQKMEPVGLGDLLARIERLKAALAAEGLFDEARKQPLPVLPRTIGVITGRNSDAKKDILRNVTARWSAAEFAVEEVATQGSMAPMEVAAALERLDARGEVDVVVIARGGGALEEVILPFSDERLIRAVAAANTPVVSAIGHEADRPLLDEVADVRASTPTGTAKLLVPDELRERENIAQSRVRMSQGLERRLAREAEWLESMRTRPALSFPEGMVQVRREDVRALRHRSLVSTQTAVDRAYDWVESTRSRVKALSPQSTLDRGYAVVQHQRQIVRRAQELQPGVEVRVMVSSGEFTAEVTDIDEEQTR